MNMMTAMPATSPMQPTPSTFRRAQAAYFQARRASLADPADDKARDAYGAATDAALGARVRGYQELQAKVEIALRESRHGPDMLRKLFWDLYERPCEEELLSALCIARDVMADELDSIRFTCSDLLEDGGLGSPPDPEDAAFLAQREQQLSKVEAVLAHAGMMSPL